VPRALILGGRGQLAQDLAAVLPAATALGRDEVDVTDATAVRDSFHAAVPDVVLNCAAYVNVDACEGDGGADAWRVNVAGALNVARACAAVGARLVHYSTNYVFGGDRDEPYGEDDLPAPGGVYAITKLAGEQAVLAYCPGALVIRSAGLYGGGGNRSKGGNFVDRILAAARQRGSLAVVDDQWLTPTFTGDLAVATAEALDRGAGGIVHLTNGGACTWHGFTVEIMRLAGVEVAVAATATEPRPGVAARPRNGLLARPRADALGLTPLRDWREALAAYVAAP
jgi:dTDP-4-dehydrorhamnose reductase